MNDFRTTSQIIEPETAIEGKGVKVQRSILRVNNEYDPPRLVMAV